MGYYVLNFEPTWPGSSPPRQTHFRSGINFDSLNMAKCRIGARYHMVAKMRSMTVTAFEFDRRSHSLIDQLRLGGNSADALKAGTNTL